ncbi:FG-GAP repeat domain-containing protein, partial [Couchioplanes caeruleus]
LAAITLTAGLPAVAHAAPVSGLSATLRNAVAAEASYEQKLAVASKFGLGDDLPLLERADYDFVIEIWKHVKDKPDLIEVRIAAEEAFGTSSTSADPQAANRACAEFIVSGAKAAYDRDIAREKRKADDKRLSDQARAAAAASIRVVADAELLRGTDAQFIGLIWELADEDPQWVNVKAAAKAARKGTPEEQKRFIASGMAAAAKEDVERRIREDDDKTAAEKAAELARAAKKHAADRIRLPVNEQLLNLPDRDFVTAVWNHAADGSEVHAAARSAARSADPAVWKAFIDTGIDQAVDRDIENALDAAEAEDRRRAQDILTRAEQALHRNLAKAARGALAGTADDVAAFLRKGQYDAYELDEAAALKAHKIRAFYDYSGSATRLFTFGKLGGPAASETQNWDSSAGNYDAARSKPVAGDFDGNGVQDIAAFYDYGNGHTKLFLFSDVDNGTGPRQVWDSGHGNWESARASYVAGDFDGDGRAEIGAFYDYGNAQTKLFVYDDVTGTPTARVVSDSKVGNW